LTTRTDAATCKQVERSIDRRTGVNLKFRVQCLPTALALPVRPWR
jgi:hypothetical protein